jgi:hypothetical protein
LADCLARGEKKGLLAGRQPFFNPFNLLNFHVQGENTLWFHLICDHQPRGKICIIEQDILLI